MREYRQKNREQLNKYIKTWRETHKEQIRQQHSLYCKEHRQDLSHAENERYKKNRDTLLPRRRQYKQQLRQIPIDYKKLAEKFWSKVVKTPTCWIWTGTISQRGRREYGRLGIQERMLQAHRISWELHNGPIPKGMYVLHHCDNPPCVNPNHLFLGTAKDNAVDMAQKGRARNQWTKNRKTYNAILSPNDGV